MAEEEKKPEMGEEAAETKPPEQPREEAADASQPAYAELKAELEKVRKALKDANKEAADRRKRLDELEKAESERQQAQMSEQEKLQAQLKELQTSIVDKERIIKDNERRELQRKVAKAVGLPDGLASRLAGDDEGAMTEDAETILELLPKPQEEKKQTPPKLDPTNPSDGRQAETVAQKRARLLGANVNPWSSSGAADRGGGVVIADKD